MDASQSAPQVVNHYITYYIHIDYQALQTASPWGPKGEDFEERAEAAD